MTIYDSEKIKRLKAVAFSGGYDTESGVAIRVKNGSNVLFTSMVGTDVDYTIKAADNVFGGADKVISVKGGDFMVLLNITPYIQQSGEYKGCVIIDSNGDTGRANIFELD